MIRFVIGPDVEWPGVSKVIEECGELIKVLGKLQAYPDGDYPDGSDLNAELHDEVADVRAALEFLVAENRLDDHFIRERAAAKGARFRHWQAGNVEALPVPSYGDSA